MLSDVLLSSLQLNNGWLSLFGGHLRLEFGLQRGPLHTELVAWGWAFGQFQCRHTCILKVWPWCFDHLFRIWHVSYYCHLLGLRAIFLLCGVNIGLPCHMSKILWTLAIRCNFLSSASLFTSKLFSVFVISNVVLSPSNSKLLTPAMCPTITILQRVWPVVEDCLQLITSHPREQLMSTSMLCGILENISFATIERLVEFDCVFSSWCHQSVISGIENVLLIFMRSEL